MRLAAGLPHGTYFGVAALVTGNLVGARLADRALMPTIGGALNHSAFNFANAIGAWLGGLAIAAGWGWASLGSAGVLLAISGLAVFGGSLVLQPGATGRTVTVLR